VDRKGAAVNPLVLKLKRFARLSDDDCRVLDDLATTDVIPAY
jgi:hypothetical protein